MTCQQMLSRNVQLECEYNLCVDTKIAMGKKRKNRTKLTRDEIEIFRAALLAKRAEISGDVISVEGEALRGQKSDLSRLPTHMADIGTDNYEVENALEIIDSERKLIAEIDDALARIENGTYGICEGSGKPIPKARLEAIPWARYCVEHATQLEKGLVKREGSFDNSKYDYEIDDEEDRDLGQSYKKA